MIKAANKQLSDIERHLPDLREHNGITFQYLQERGLYTVSVYRMERGDNYSFQSLLRYLYFLNCKLVCNGRRVGDLTDFGQALRAQRMKLGLTQADVISSSGLTPRGVVNVEHGRGYKRDTLLKYLGVVPVKLEITDMLDA